MEGEDISKAEAMIDASKYYIEQLVERLLDEAKKREIDVDDLQDAFDLYGEENPLQDDMNYDILCEMRDEIISRLRDEGFPVHIKEGKIFIHAKGGEAETRTPGQ